MTTQRMIIGISGASGIMYGVRLLEVLRTLSIETHLVVSPAGQLTRAHETAMSKAALHALADAHYAPQDISAPIASGSFKTMGMIIAPCSMKSLSEIAHGASNQLLSRAADVVLKERRRLILLPRETPLHLVHLRNMVSITEMGGIIFPPVPAFYQHPKTIDDLINDTVGRVLDLFGLESGLVQRWGEKGE